MRGRVRSFLAVAVLIRSAAGAQSGPDNDPAQAQGFAKNVFHHSSVDSINQYNGQLTVPVPIGPTFQIGPSLAFQLVLTYNTRLTEPGHPTDTTSPNYYPVVGDPALGIGWSLTPGKIACSALSTSGSQGGPCYVRPDGAQIDFPPGGGRAADGSGYELVHNGASPADTYTMFDGDGARFDFTRRIAGYDDNARESPQQGPGYARDFGRGRDGYYLTAIRDSFGNTLTVSYAPDGVIPCPSACPAPAPVGSMRCTGSTSSWIPASFRIQRVGEAGPTEVVQVMTDPSTEMIKGFRIRTFRDGTSQFSQWDLMYGSVRLASRAPNLYCPTTLPTLIGISLPSDVAGTSGYGFSYFPEGGLATGLLKSMTLPTGATVFYDYGNYHFYHGRRALFSESDPCNGFPSPPPPSQGVRRSVILTNSGGPGHRPESTDGDPEKYAPTQGPCLPYVDSRQFEQHLLGVVQRATSGPDMATSLTNYTQYSFPFGENGNTDAQTLTVALLPADADGVRRAETTLFWAAKQILEPGAPPTPGDRLGADLRHAVFEGDPNPGAGTLITPPLCGGSAEEDRLCATHAIRVTQNLYQYDTDGPALPSAEDDGVLRRLRKTTTYYGRISATDPVSPEYCPACLKHSVTLSLVGANTWEGNGRHYDKETHDGNLGGDRREVTTVWTPQPGAHLWNLYASRVETDPDIPAASGLTATRNVVDRSFFFDPATGFLSSTLTWDAPTSRYAGSCRYPDAAGNAADEVTATVVRTIGKPVSNPCFASLAAWAPGVIGLNGDAFGQRSAYAAGLLGSRRWIQDRTPLSWFSSRVDRDSVTGWITASYDTAGLATAFRYDSLGRVTRITPPGAEAGTDVAYLDARTTTASRSGADDASWQQSVYDGLGRLIREVRQMPVGYAFRTRDYDAAGHERFVSEWKSCASVSAGGNCLTGTATLGTTLSQFDPFGRPQSVRKADGSTTTVSFADGATPYSDTRKAMTVANVGCTWNGAACVGGSASTAAYRYDASGRLVTVLEPSGDITTYAYDVAGKLVSVAQGAQTRTFSYDSLGYLIRETTPEAGTVDHTAVQGTTTYSSWGSLGNPVSRVDGWGSSSPVTRSYRYDAAGRPLCEVSGVLAAGQNCDSTGLALYVQNFYDGNGFAGGSYPSGKLTRRDGYNRILSPTLTLREEFTYSHPTGRLSQQTTSVRNGSAVQSAAVQSWTYDALGLIKDHYYPRSAGSFKVSFGHTLGYVTSVTAGGQNVVNRASYAPSGSLASWTAGNGTGGADGVVTTIAQDPSTLARPSRISTSAAIATSAGGNFDSGVYRYDGAGNIVAIGADTFGYDLRSRLTAASYSGTGAQAFSYDRYGNLLSDGSGQAFCATTCANNRLPAPYAYDTRGNLKANGTAETMTHDDLSRQVRYQATGAVDWRYLYTGAGERTAKVAAGGATQYTYRDEGNRVATEYWDATLARDNLFLGNLLVASYVSSAAAGSPGWQWYHSDHLGTPRLVTNAARAVVESRKYWPYGNGIPAQAGTLQKLRFCSMERDSENLRYYDHARTHDAVTGRFTSLDQAGARPASPQSWNRYSYALANPLKHIDPDGRLTIVVHGTWASGNPTFTPGGDFFSRVARTVNDRSVGAFSWSGGNTRADRASAAHSLAALIHAYKFAPGEQLNLVAHSHGGNVAIDAVNLGLRHKVNNLVLLGTPARAEYRLEDRSAVDRFIAVSSPRDPIQMSGGSAATVPLIGEVGPAGRLQPDAINVYWSTAGDPLDEHSALYKEPAAWMAAAENMNVRSWERPPESSLFFWVRE